jgi:hypothetical protein
MRRNIAFSFMALSAFLCAALLGGCGSSKKEGAADPLSTPTAVGSASCTNICHAATVDVTGNPIAATWAATTHTTVSGVQCENCHGGGSLHRGVGPIPFPNPPASQCAQVSCHPVIHGSTTPALADFNITRHANIDQAPSASFSQIPTPVSAGKHVEECSRCHNPNQRFEFDFAGNLVKPSLAALPSPAVTCASCHDGHQPQQQVTVPQRTAKVGYPIFRKFLVDPATGAQVNDGTAGAQNQAAFIFQPNGAARSGPINNALVVGRNNEVNPDMLCAACHTKGTYKNSGQVTHQDDIHTQWTQSGHGDRNAAAFAEFAANPGAYINEATGTPFTDVSHRTTYPIDMALSRYVTAGPATPAQNAGNNNYACFKCHNGLTSLAYQDSVQGTPLAPVVFGDATVTCITCHDPHKDAPGNRKNTRKPVVMTTYSAAVTGAASLKFSGNVFLDNTPVPAATGNETICVFCHQGRESGFTLFIRRLAPGRTVTGSFLNEHYLGTGGMLWGRNAFEYGGKQYGQNAAHQQANCNSCHMTQSGRNDLGGHSWKIFAADGAVNNVSCNASSCHNGRVPATKAGLDAFRDTVFDPSNDYDGDGNITEGIPEEVRDLCLQLRDLLQSNGVFYNDLAYPYFFQANLTSAFTAWTPAKLKAAFNLQYVIKGLPSAAATQVGQPNPSAATHNHRYIIQLLRDSYDDLFAKEPTGRGTNLDRSAQVRPAGTRPATNYLPDAAGPGGYNANQ